MSMYRPTGYYETASEWAKLTYTHHEIVFPAHRDISRMPRTVDGGLHWKHDNEVRQMPPAGSVTVIPGGRLWGKNGTVVTPDDKVVWDLSIEYRHDPYTLPIFREQIGQPERLDGNVADLTFCASDTYYHWMLDVLPRVELLSKYKGPGIDAYVCNLDWKCSFQWDTLTRLGVTSSKIIETYPGFHLQARNLIAPSSVGYTGHAPAWACQFLRSRFLYADGTSRPARMERIYLSRQKARWRKVENEEEVIGLLRRYGFEILTDELDRMSVSEQAALFHAAEFIVGPHGSGLTNVLFCHPDAKVLEFHSPNYVNPLYWVLGNHVGADYFYLIGEGPRPPDGVDPKEDWENIRVDLGKLERSLQLMGC